MRVVFVSVVPPSGYGTVDFWVVVVVVSGAAVGVSSTVVQEESESRAAMAAQDRISVFIGLGWCAIFSLGSHVIGEGFAENDTNLSNFNDSCHGVYPYLAKRRRK